MAYNAVLDADVLFPASLRDTLLRLAELELFDPLWSDQILDEMKRTLIRRRPEITQAQTNALAATMNDAFEDALVDADAVTGLTPAMTNHPKDRHVLAAAVARDAGGIVTNNVKDFPPASCDPYGITVTTADEFLCILFDLNPDAVSASVRRQADELRNPPLTLQDLLRNLERGGAREFVKRVREHEGLANGGLARYFRQLQARLRRD